MEKPRYIRIYDNGGKTFDRYTVVFTGRYKKRMSNEFIHLGMSDHPFHPLGFGQHGYSDDHIDRPTYSHLGKPMKWEDLTEDCQKCVWQTYNLIWPVKK